MCGSVALLLLDCVAFFLPTPFASRMPVTTEIYTLALIAGSDIRDPKGTTAAVVKECCDIVAGQERLQRLWFGTEHESPGTLQLFLGEWSAAVLCRAKGSGLD